MLRRILSLLLIVFFTATGYGQSVNPVFKNITRSSGLPVDEVTCIAQDSIGFIWLGTKEGLYRYDGFSYKGFYNIPGDVHTIPGNYITHIHIDSKGLLWIISSRAGIAVMKSNGQVLQVINSFTNTRFGTDLDETFDVKEGKNGLFWCTTSNGLYKLKKGKDSIKVTQQIKLTDYHHPTSSLGPFVIDNSGKLWLCTFKGIAIYDPVKDILYNANNNPAQLSFLNDTAHAVANVFVDEERGKLWYSTWEPAIRIYDIKTKMTTTIYAPEEYVLRDYNQVVHTFFRDSKENIWMGIGNGVSLFGNNLHKIFTHQQDNIYSINKYAVLDIYEDREDNFWFATSEGISTAQPYYQPFTNFSSNSTKEYGFSKQRVTCIVPADSHTFLIGTSNGVFETDNHFNVKKHFSFGILDYDWIWTYYQDSLHHQVFFSAQGGMLLYNTKTHRIKKLTTPPFDDHRPVSSFAGADDGNIWMCHYRNDFFKYNPADKTFKKYNLTGLGEKPQVLHIYKGKDHYLWLLADEVGLLRFDEKKEKIVERIIAKSHYQNGLLQSGIVLVQDLGKTLFIGYVSKGFSLYDKASKTFRHFSQADGLASNGVSGAVQTKDGVLWIATTNGISRFDTVKKVFINYNYSNGILENNFETIIQLPDGRIAAGSREGLVFFHPDSIKSLNHHVPPPIITGISVYGKTISVDSLVSAPLQISYKENYFSIDYISLRYDNNQQIEYAYQLEGLDKNWIPAGSRRFVSYANLSGGHYYFHVRARLPGGNWSESKVPLSIYVSAAFYTQWWFYASLALFTAFIFYAVYRYRINQLLKLQNMRRQIASDLHDDIGSTLTSISYYSEIVKMQVKEEAGVNVLLDKIGNNARNMVSAMSDIVWVINPANDATTNLVSRMKSHASGMLDERNIQCIFEAGEEEKAKLNLQQRKNIYLIYKEALNNAIKYAACRTIIINLAQTNKLLTLQISDDGKGFDKLQATEGNGLTNMKKRAAEMNATLCIDTAPGKGTLVQFQVKIT